MKVSIQPRAKEDTASLRKARGAFFTPSGITEHLAEWAIREPTDQVLEPSVGEAAFLVAAVDRLHGLGAVRPVVHGVDVHRDSAAIAQDLLKELGAEPSIRVSDFFLVAPEPKFDAVIGNPPFIRYQEWSGEQRDRSRFAALQQGVALTGLASSWAGFVAHAAGFLKPGGRLALVLPAELLSVNYAAPVRRFLLQRFRSVELVVFDEQVFPDAEADTVLVKADGWSMPASGEAVLRQAVNAAGLEQLAEGTSWSPADATDRWSPIRLAKETTAGAAALLGSGTFVPLAHFGDVKLGAVTGANRFFALSPARVRELGIPRRDLVRVSPPGSAHLRNLTLTDSGMTRLGQRGEATWLVWPADKPAEATMEYLESGHRTGVDEAYKCRVRSPWWRVPLLPPPDLFLTYMNADMPRLVSNAAGARHLNSVHGVYLREQYAATGTLLPLASLNSLTALSAEIEGRSYGGGVLKIEPREAARWWMPSPVLIAQTAHELEALRPRVQRLLQAKNVRGAIEAVDAVILRQTDPAVLDAIRSDGGHLRQRRMVRGQSRG